MPEMGRIPHQLLLSFLVQSALIRNAAAMFYYPNAQISQIEHILVDNWGAYASNFSSAITPCDRYVTQIGDAAVKSGRTTSAQWLRVLFHDFANSHVEEGLGGIDASIGFETYREENKGSAFNDSFTFWRPFVNEFIPMADLLAMGTVMSVGLCGNGTKIPFRPGRVDASSEDPNTGVPEPGTSLEETLRQFELNGFNQEDAIALTACGHTLGSTHHRGFPEVSDNSTLSENNTNGGINFDSSRGIFDPLVVQEYIDGTGQRGGPLVTSFNESSRSDLRLFESDGNATMKALYAQGEGFIGTCVDLLSRVINTVPAGVVLQDAVKPMAIKPVNVTWDIGDNGVPELSGRIRILEKTSQDRTITLMFSNGYNEMLTMEEEIGTSIFGETQFAPFVIAHSKIDRSTSFTVDADGLNTDNANNEFAIQDSYLIIPSLSSVIGGSSVKVTVAMRDDANNDTELSVLATVPTAQPLTLGPKMVSAKIALERIAATASGPNGFTLWEGSTDIDRPTGAVSVRLVRDGETLDTLLLDGGVAGW
ncbi:heme peroxidase [Xylaria bambusicola]|uniref:heme peroxidase n=1 Tax=Xylaria bambusicola TaxID=326684 RepID=UPI002008D7CD|nr:heme peroxidase [Xylaria bambusicola]KAI0517284.1 heme peroxidase [Xylaria bambusicola]